MTTNPNPPADSSVVARTDYARATRTLRERIERGVYQPGERLPSERDLAQSLGMARHTRCDGARPRAHE